MGSGGYLDYICGWSEAWTVQEVREGWAHEYHPHQIPGKNATLIHVVNLVYMPDGYRKVLFCASHHLPPPRSTKRIHKQPRHMPTSPAICQTFQILLPPRPAEIGCLKFRV